MFPYTHMLLIIALRPLRYLLADACLTLYVQFKVSSTRFSKDDKELFIIQKRPIVDVVVRESIDLVDNQSARYVTR